MKKSYISPNTEVRIIKSECLLDLSIQNINGADGITKGQGNFGGGASDSKERGTRNTDSFEDLW